ncbi:MAG TPA: arylsulfatase [Microscillaceae bacterium]|nr:arylsulfatase [Microscillaceae bacterium]
MRWLIKVFGYFGVFIISVLLLFSLYVIAKATILYSALTPEHLAQKTAYLKKVSLLPRNERPNVVIIYFDDLGYGDLSSYGNALIRTPWMDSIAGQGLLFTRFYSSASVCTPARAALLTGRYPPRHHTHRHVFFPEGSPVAFYRKARGLQNALPKDEILLPEVLQAAGFQTALVGKWHLGDKKGHQPNDFGFQMFYGVHFSNDMKPFQVFLNDQVVIPPDKIDQRNLTELYTQKAVEFIKLQAQNQQPFFLYFAHTFPHVPHFVAEKFKGKSSGGLYGDIVEALDYSVGEIWQTLRQAGIADNTILIITSDNGADFGGSAGHFRGRKQEVFEGGFLVPFIVSYPAKMKKAAVVEDPFMALDVFPTLLELMNIPLPDDRTIDGKSLSQVWLGQTSQSPHEDLLFFEPFSGKIGAIRQGIWKYHTRKQKLVPNLFYPLPNFLTVFAEPALYDLTKDQESHNLIALQPAVAKQLENKIAAEEAALQKNQRGWK